MCEFCSTENEVDIAVPDEVPLKEEVLYMITPGASAGSSGAMVGGQAGKDALVVFCIDTSGSMGTTTEVRIHVTEILSKIAFYYFVLPLCCVGSWKVSTKGTREASATQ